MNAHSPSGARIVPDTGNVGEMNEKTPCQETNKYRFLTEQTNSITRQYLTSKKTPSLQPKYRVRYHGHLGSYIRVVGQQNVPQIVDHVTSQTNTIYISDIVPTRITITRSNSVITATTPDTSIDEN